MAVSIGIGDDVTWDLAVAAQGASVHMFDHTVHWPSNGGVPRGTYAPLGVGAANPGGIPENAANPHGDRRCLVRRAPAYLKMDVEGAEWSSLAACRPGLLGAFDQIVMELHDLDRLLDADSGSEVLTALAARSPTSTCPIHIHANNYARVVRFGTYWFPKAVEVSWVHRRHLTATEPADSLAKDLDRPCDPRVTDIDLSAITRIPHTAGSPGLAPHQGQRLSKGLLPVTDRSALPVPPIGHAQGRCTPAGGRGGGTRRSSWGGPAVGSAPIRR